MRTVAEIVDAYDRTNHDAIPDDEWALLIARAKERCASWEIDPRKIEFMNGPDEWGVIEGKYESAFTRIHDDELCSILWVINDQATGIHDLWIDSNNSGTAAKDDTMSEKMTTQQKEAVIDMIENLNDLKLATMQAFAQLNDMHTQIVHVYAMDYPADAASDVLAPYPDRLREIMTKLREATK